MTFETLTLSIVFGLVSNTLAELLLSFELKQPFGLLDGIHQRMRLMRWLVCLAGFIFLGMVHPSLLKLILLGLFSVSAATDFETQFLPPDWFVYGSVAVGLGAGLLTGNISSLRDAVVAQAVCFAMMVFAVIVANAADSGDIKLLMQYGATAGSLRACLRNLN